MPGIDGVEATRRIMGESPCAILVVTATVSGHLGKVYQAMGYGALDAVDTPTLGPRGRDRGAAVLLHKIELIGRLVGKPRPAGPGDWPPGIARRRCRTAAASSRIARAAGRRWAPRPAARRPWPRSSAELPGRGWRPRSSSSSTSTRPSRRAGPVALRAGAAARHADRAGPPARRRRGLARRHRRPPDPRRGPAAPLFARAAVGLLPPVGRRLLRQRGPELAPAGRRRAA